VGEEDVENQGAGEIVVNERSAMFHGMEGEGARGHEDDNGREGKRLAY